MQLYMGDNMDINAEQAAIPAPSYCHHYIATDAAGNITGGWSDGPLPERAEPGAICLTERGGYQFRLWPGGEENPPLMDARGIWLYRYAGGSPVRKADGEIEAESAALPAYAPPLTDVEVLMLAVAELAETVEGLRAEMEAPK